MSLDYRNILEKSIRVNASDRTIQNNITLSYDKIGSEINIDSIIGTKLKGLITRYHTNFNKKVIKTLNTTYEILTQEETRILTLIQNSTHENFNTLLDFMTRLYASATEFDDKINTNTSVSFIDQTNLICALFYFKTHKKTWDKTAQIYLNSYKYSMIIDDFIAKFIQDLAPLDETDSGYALELKNKLKTLFHVNNKGHVSNQGEFAIVKINDIQKGLIAEFTNTKIHQMNKIGDVFVETIGTGLAPEKQTSGVNNIVKTLGSSKSSFNNQLTAAEFKPDTQLTLKLPNEEGKLYDIILNIQDKFSAPADKEYKDQYYSTISYVAPYSGINMTPFNISLRDSDNLGKLLRQSILYASFLNPENSLSESTLKTLGNLFGETYALPLFATGLLGYIYTNDKHTTSEFNIHTMPILIHHYSGYSLVSDVIKDLIDNYSNKANSLWNSKYIYNMLGKTIQTTNHFTLLRTTVDKREQILKTHNKEINHNRLQQLKTKLKETKMSSEQKKEKIQEQYNDIDIILTYKELQDDIQTGQIIKKWDTNIDKVLVPLKNTFSYYYNDNKEKATVHK